ncbi:hypothetical protein I4Q42_07555 [Caulobacter hibisci]|uniref:Surface-adhesin protein E-like domain-containing protein n=2 Tax=Caulobacter hibisci TaxID=2035993 RepID=A0ABS0SXV0_9CAUL|nr:surface-adhesin E family protein [Caulobacter hibisci]MBI1683518.1 hypothetical protein [Caulobacter hibisci]
MAVQAAAPVPPAAQTSVDGVTVTAQEKAKALPPWADKVRSDGWPFFAAAEEGMVLMFAKTAKGNDGLAPRGQVWVRHEFRTPRTEAEAPAAPAFRSEKLLVEVDCTAGRFRNAAAFRYPNNNLEGAEDAYRFEQDWQAPAAGTLDATVVEAACLTP